MPFNLSCLRNHDKWTHYASTFFLYEKPEKWLKYRVFGTFSPLSKFIKISKRQPILPFFGELNGRGLFCNRWIMGM